MSNEKLFVNGDIYTMDPNRPRARSLLCRDDRIVSVDPTSSHPIGVDEAEVVDLEGRTVVPGFIDAHCHLELTTTHLSYAVQCFAPPHRSIVEICDTLRKHAHQVPEGGWLVGRADFGLHQFVEEQRPITRQDLDAAIPDLPTVVYSGMHVCTINTAGLRASGLLDGAQLSRGPRWTFPPGAAWNWHTGFPTPTSASTPRRRRSTGWAPRCSPRGE